MAAEGVEGIPRPVPELWRPADPAGPQGNDGRRRQGGVLSVRRPGLPAARRVGLAAFDGVNGVDLSGPLEVFSTATVLDPARPGYAVEVVAATLDPLRTEAGLRILPDRLFAEAARL